MKQIETIRDLVKFQKIINFGVPRPKWDICNITPTPKAWEHHRMGRRNVRARGAGWLLEDGVF